MDFQIAGCGELVCWCTVSVAPPEGKGGSFPPYGWASKNYVICVIVCAFIVMKLLRITRQIHCKAVEQIATLIHRQYSRDWGTSYSRPPIPKPHFPPVTKSWRRHCTVCLGGAGLSPQYVVSDPSASCWDADATASQHCVRGQIISIDRGGSGDGRADGWTDGRAMAAARLETFARIRGTYGARRV